MANSVDPFSLTREGPINSRRGPAPAAEQLIGGMSDVKPVDIERFEAPRVELQTEALPKSENPFPPAISRAGPINPRRGPMPGAEQVVNNTAGVTPMDTERFADPETRLETSALPKQSPVQQPAPVAPVAPVVGETEQTAPPKQTFATQPIAPVKQEKPKVTEQVFSVVDPASGSPVNFKSQKDLDAFEAKKEQEMEARGLSKSGMELIDNRVQMLLDPTKTVNTLRDTELNNIISTLGPQNQAAMDQLQASIKANDLDGTGAGNAMLTMLQRATNTNMSQIVGKLNAEATQRIMDLNAAGGDYGLRLRNQARTETVNNMADEVNKLAIADEFAQQTGDFSGVAEMAEQITGQPVDAEALREAWEFDDTFTRANQLRNIGLQSKAADLIKENFPFSEFDETEWLISNPARQTLYNQAISAASAITNPEDKKAAWIDIALRFPEMFGFQAGEGEKAAAWASQQRFENLDAVVEQKKKAATDLRAESIKEPPDWATVDAISDASYENMGDEQVLNQFTNEIKSLQSDQIAKNNNILSQVLSDMGLSLEELDTKEEQARFLSRAKVYRNRSNISKLVDEMFIDLKGAFLSAVPEGDQAMFVNGENVTGNQIAGWFTDPDMAPMVKEWVASTVVGGNYEIDQNGNFAIKDGAAIPPWVDGSPIRDRITSWPNFYDANGELLKPGEVGYYQGGEVYGLMDPNDAQNSKPEIIAERERLIKQYQNYKGNGGELNRNEWMIATKDGQLGIPDEDLLDEAREAGIIGEGPGATSLEAAEKEAATIKEFQDLVKTGKLDEITPEMVTTALDPIAAEDLPFGDLTEWNKANAATGGIVNVSGIPMRVIKGERYPGNKDVALIQIHGTDEKYWRDESGKWYKYVEGQSPIQQKGVFNYSIGLVADNFEEFKKLVSEEE